MRYEGALYRPPSEAYSLIIQATIGCSHNKCTFCSMYKEKKFRVRKLDEILQDLEEGRSYYKRVKRIFLADGNALALNTQDLKTILIKIQQLFPECERVGIYSAPKDILRKTKEELAELKALGLGIAYMGLESGSDEILEKIKKGVTAGELIEAGRKIKESGLTLSVTLISGLGGIEKWEEHAAASAQVVNAIDPHYLGLLTLLVEDGTELYEEIRRKEFQLLMPREIMRETYKFIEGLNVTECMIRSNHPSNYIALHGNLPQDKERLLNELRGAIEQEENFKDEFFRRL